MSHVLSAAPFLIGMEVTMERRETTCVSSLYSLLEDSNIQLSAKQKKAVVDVVYPSIEHSRMKAYDYGKKQGESEMLRMLNPERLPPSLL